MAGTVAGGRKAAATNKMRYGLNFYEQIGRKGGKMSHGGYFSRDYVHPITGQTGPELAAIAGKKGGQTSRRTKLAKMGV